MADMAPWKRELFEKTAALEETEEFQKGVIAGYHEAGINIAIHTTVTPEVIAQWAAGFAAGYVARLHIEEERKNGSTS